MNLLTMRPDDIQRAIADRPLAWVPLGAIEWHGLHAPVGLDCLTSEGLCQKAQAELGGIILPPLHYGAYASIASHPWTVLLTQDDSEIIERLLLRTLTRLEEFGIKTAVIVTGHFATEQLLMLERLKQKWNSVWRAMTLIVIIPSECPDLALDPDHGGLFESSLLEAITPGAIDLSKLPDTPLDEEDSAGPQRRDPSHPLYGIIGQDPRRMDKKQAAELLRCLTEWITSSVRHQT